MLLFSRKVQKHEITRVGTLLSTHFLSIGDMQDGVFIKFLEFN